MNKITLMVCCVPFVLAVSSTSQAQVMVDMSKITCEQLLKGSGNSIEAAIWLSGYYNGLRKNTKLDLNQYRKNAEIIVAECKDSPKATVMQTIKTMTSRKK
jgi:HdeA/HdeB family protein